MKLHCPHCATILGIKTHGVKLHRRVQANDRKFTCMRCGQAYGHTFMDERSRFGKLYYWIKRFGSGLRRVISWK